MPAYSFEAVDAQGATRQGILEADTLKSGANLDAPLLAGLVSSGLPLERAAATGI
jgi:hypothetical protein